MLKRCHVGMSACRYKYLKQLFSGLWHVSVHIHLDIDIFSMHVNITLLKGFKNWKYCNSMFLALTNESKKKRYTIK